MSDIRVLIVCLGNICRSPMGEAVLRDVAKQRGLEDKVFVDSAGTAAYHAGDDPDDRTVAVCKKHGVPISHAARQVVKEDFKNFTHILASDNSNFRDLERMKPKSGSTAEVRLWGSYANSEVIPDPYYGGTSGFENVYQLCLDLSNAFLDEHFGKS